MRPMIFLSGIVLVSCFGSSVQAMLAPPAGPFHDAVDIVGPSPQVSIKKYLIAAAAAGGALYTLKGRLGKTKDHVTEQPLDNQEAALEEGSLSPFSLKELTTRLQGFPVSKPSFLDASDGTKLAYYSYVPADPKAIVVFCHGAGLHSGALYQYFAQQLSENHAIGCYLFDRRGHGFSEGPRGDAPSVQQMFDDITTAIDFVGSAHSGTPIFLGGHSAGGGLILNYGASTAHPLVKGSILIAPYLGRNSEALKTPPTPAEAFVKSVKVWMFILNGISNGRFCGHSPAVFFNHPQELIKKDPLIVTNYTVTMMTACSPENPRQSLEKLAQPLALFASENDELFDAPTLIGYKSSFPLLLSNMCVADKITQSTHLDCMLDAAPYCASFINRIV